VWSGTHAGAVLQRFLLTRPRKRQNTLLRMVSSTASSQSLGAPTLNPNPLVRYKQRWMIEQKVPRRLRATLAVLLDSVSESGSALISGQGPERPTSAMQVAAAIRPKASFAAS
jgi:hypothetical protein